MAGKLYIVPTPVGNLDDMTPRAVQVLQQATLILAEDTRTSSVLMHHFGITTPMRAHHKFNEHDTVSWVIEQLQNGATIALVSDAGTPAISDPGFLLARECRNSDIEVETLPGATAFVPALVNSGLPCDRFTFEERTVNSTRGTQVSAAHNDFLRVAVTTTEDAAADGRYFRPRPRSIGVARDIQVAQLNSQWHTGSTHRPLHRQRATRRDSDRGCWMPRSGSPQSR